MTIKAINCLVIDDELSSQKVLQHFIAKTEVLHLKSTYSNTAEAFKHLQLYDNIDLLFLDINMPKTSGIDFYKTLKQPPKVIFTTAYPQYAVEGFEVNATDYLLKPIPYNRFLMAVKKVLDILDTDKTETDDFIILKQNKVLHKVYFNTIFYAEAYGDYVKVYTEKHTITTHSTFSKFSNQLPKHFLRVHKSFSINSDKMTSISGNKILLEDYTIPIGQTYKQAVLKALKL